VCFQLFQRLVEVVAEAAVRALERDFPGLLPLLTPPWPGMSDV
jgi:hypothetical protein